jgi:hypothetical protein
MGDRPFCLSSAWLRTASPIALTGNRAVPGAAIAKVRGKLLFTGLAPCHFSMLEMGGFENNIPK